MHQPAKTNAVTVVIRYYIVCLSAGLELATFELIIDNALMDVERFKDLYNLKLASKTANS